MTLPKIIKVQSIVFAMLLLGTNVFSQSALEVVKQMNKSYASFSSYQMEVKMNVRSKDGASVMSYTGKALKQGTSMYTEIMNRKILVNDRYMVAVDQTQGLIVFGEKPKDQTQQSQSDPTAMIEQLFENTKEQMEFEGNDKQFYRVKVVLEDHPTYAHAELKIRKSDYALVSFAYQVKKGVEIGYHRLEVRYDNIKLNQKLSSKLFSEKQFVSVSEKKVTPTKAYSKYKVIDQRQEQLTH